MNRQLQRWAGGIAVVMTLAAGSVLTAALPAAADDTSPSGAYTRPDKPDDLADTLWGRSIAQLPRWNNQPATAATSGGWLSRNMYVSRWNRTAPPTTTITPVALRVGEIMMDNDGYPNFQISGQNLPDNRSDRQMAGFFTCYTTSQCVGIDSKATNTNDAHVVCSNSQWSRPNERVSFDISAGSNYSELVYSTSVDGGQFPQQLGTLRGGSYVPITQRCQYLVQVSMNLCVYTGFNIGPVCTVAAWSAEYLWEENSYPSQDVVGALCDGNIEISAECPYVDPEVDGTNFDVVCANGPTYEWFTFAWIGPMVGHYARCLFVPANGWDRNGELQNAIDKSSLQDLEPLVETASHVFDIPETCGNIAPPLTSGPLKGFAMNSCNWDPAMTDYMKTFIGFVVVGLGGYSLLIFFIKTVMSPFTKKTPLPVGDEKE